MKLNVEKINEIKTLQAEVGEEILTDLVGIYLTSVPEAIGVIKKACEQRDVDLVKRTAHSLKSTATNLGVVELAELSLHIEKSAATLSQTQLLEMTDKLSAMFEESKPLVSELMAK